MRINSVSFASSHAMHVKTSAISQTKSTPIQNHLKVSEIMPVSGALGAALTATYFIKSGHINRFSSRLRQNNINKTAEKLKNNIPNVEELTEKTITPLKKGFTKVTYTGDTGFFKDTSYTIIFNKKAKPVKEIHSIQTLTRIGKFPIGYNKQLTVVNKKRNREFIETNFALDMRPKDTTIIKNGEKQEIQYGYDINKQIKGSVRTNKNGVVYKPINSEKTKQYKSFEEAFTTEFDNDFYRT